MFKKQNKIAKYLLRLAIVFLLIGVASGKCGFTTLSPFFLMAFLYSHDQIHKKQTCLTQKLNVDRSFLGFDFYVFWIIGYYIHHVTAPSPFIKVLKRVFLHDSLRNGISKFENQMEKS